MHGSDIYSIHWATIYVSLTLVEGIVSYLKSYSNTETEFRFQIVGNSKQLTKHLIGTLDQSLIIIRSRDRGLSRP